MTLSRAAYAAGWLALLLLLLLGLGTVLAVAAKGGAGGLPPGSGATIRFTLLQALLSALASCLLAIPLARALVRQSFRGRDYIVAALAAPFLLPALVAVFGFIAVFGRSGWLNALLQGLGLAPVSIYGLPGVLLAHVFFNLPLVTRLILQGWSDIPGEQFRLAAQLNFSGGDMFRKLEWPMLRRVLPGAFLLVFLLCSTSFAVVLAVGGGPAATTVELAIYQALRFGFDLAAAAQLALVQVAICGVAALLAGRLQGAAEFGTTLGAGDFRQPQGGITRAVDFACIAVAAVFLLAPIVMVVSAGFGPLANGLPASVWPAALRSVAVALASALLTLAFGLALANLIDRGHASGLWYGRIGERVGYLTLAVSPLVMGTGLFILINPWANPFALALPVTALVNAALCIPLSLRVVLPAFSKARQRYGRLTMALDLQGWTAFRVAYWPEIRRPAMFSAALAAALSIGDLGVVALFAPPDGGTLPLVMQRLMAAYQMETAAGVAFLLMLLAFGLFWAIDRSGRNGN